jgi:hypothetical protein
VHLEHTAQSQEKDADDSEQKEHPRASTAPKKADAKKDVILVTSSGGPPEPNRYVSMQLILACLSSITPQ